MQLTDKEITKKIAEIKVIKFYEDLQNNKNPNDKLIRLTDPFGDEGPKIYDSFSYEENCILRDSFEVEIDYDNKEVRITIAIKDIHKTFAESFFSKKGISKAVLLCIIKSEEAKNKG